MKAASYKSEKADQGDERQLIAKTKKGDNCDEGS